MCQHFQVMRARELFCASPPNVHVLRFMIIFGSFTSPLFWRIFHEIQNHKSRFRRGADMKNLNRENLRKDIFKNCEFVIFVIEGT